MYYYTEPDSPHVGLLEVGGSFVRQQLEGGDLFEGKLIQRRGLNLRILRYVWKIFEGPPTVPQKFGGP